MYQDVVEQMQTAIAEGRMCPGELLPSNQELCEIFRTNEDTLHEALRILEQKGLIETRLEEGGGVFVKDANAELMAE
ncbi:MAG TPA: winged helix-turn-helix domain-containing protein, partial [Desulfopila sp.]|nr:winged helix-turn-helix domain-containing protein [Desulfopila sp.]